MNKFIIVEYKTKYSKEKLINRYINKDRNECLICFCTLGRFDIVMENNFCNCYHIVLLCGKCFSNWYKTDTRCFICRSKYMEYKEDIDDNVFIMNPIFRLKNSLKCKEFNNIRNQFSLAYRNIIIPHTQDNLEIETSVISTDTSVSQNNEHNRENRNNLDTLIYRCKLNIGTCVCVFFICSIFFYMSHSFF